MDTLYLPNIEKATVANFTLSVFNVVVGVNVMTAVQLSYVLLLVLVLVQYTFTEMYET
jgi:hypothetical protein